MRKLRLIFTRDFDQWVEEMVRNSLVVDVSREWGLGLSDQVVRFDGRTFAWYRYEDDMDALKSFVVSKPLDDTIFSRQKHGEFLEKVSELRRLIGIPYAEVGNGPEHLSRIKDDFALMYPYYPIAIFVAGPWRQDFIDAHGDVAQPVLDVLMESRHKSEGLLKEVGNYLRAWLEPLLIKSGYPKEYARLFTVKETEVAISSGELPSEKELRIRSEGYVYIDGTIVPVTDFSAYLSAHDLSLAHDDAASDVIQGTVAYKGGTYRGTVGLIFNSYEVGSFAEGSVLVTPMTAPDFMPAILKASAVVTDEGGITCHAAIVAREMRKPCIIGTRVATRLLKDGDTVEVDTEKGTVRKLDG